MSLHRVVPQTRGVVHWVLSPYCFYVCLLLYVNKVCVINGFWSPTLVICIKAPLKFHVSPIITTGTWLIIGRSKVRVLPGPPFIPIYFKIIQHYPWGLSVTPLIVVASTPYLHLLHSFQCCLQTYLTISEHPLTTQSRPLVFPNIYQSEYAWERRVAAVLQWWH